MTTYDVTVTRSDGVWFCDIAGLPPNYIGATDVLRLADLDIEVRDLVAGLLQVDPEEFDLNWRIMFGDTDVSKYLDELADITEGIDRLEGARSALRRELIRLGRQAGYSQAVIADALRMSQQRVGQLIRDVDQRAKPLVKGRR